MKPRSFERGASLLEMVICVGMSVIILGALLISSMSIQKSIHGSEVFSSTYSDQRRIIDYLGRDIRRASSISATDPSGGPCPLGTAPIHVSGLSSIVLSLPGYYKSNVPKSADFQSPLPVITQGDGVDYGDAATFASPVQVTFRKAFVPRENCECFLRQEAGIDDIVVRDAKDLDLQIALSSERDKVTVTASFFGPYSSNRTVISTSEDLMLRNVPQDYLP